MKEHDDELPQNLRDLADELFNTVIDTNFPETGGLVDENAFAKNLRALVICAWNEAIDEASNMVSTRILDTRNSGTVNKGLDALADDIKELRRRTK